MGLRFRRSFRLFPGVKINVSKSGLSTSFGGPGASVNVSQKGVRATIGLPGTGLSYSTLVAKPRAGGTPSLFNQAGFWQPAPQAQPPVQTPLISVPRMDIIGNASIEQLSSPSLYGFLQMILDLRKQRRDIEADLRDATLESKRRSRELNWKRKPLIRTIFRKRISELESLVPHLAVDVIDLQSWLDASLINVQFDLNPIANQAYSNMYQSYLSLCRMACIWDLTAHRVANQVRERTTASRIIQRSRIQMGLSGTSPFTFAGHPLYIPNCNGEALQIFPGFIYLERPDGVVAVVDLRSVSIEFDHQSFIEEEAVPPDSQIVGYTWAKANKDGSPDRRFANNYQIPICLYGRIVIRSATGLHKEYQFSNAQSAMAFGSALAQYLQILKTS